MSEEAVPFSEMTPAWRVHAVEDTRRRLLDLAAETTGKPRREDPPLSPKAEVWLRRMRSALCDADCSSATVAQMKVAFQDALPEAEGAELDRRLREFERCRNMIPSDAISAAPVLRAARRRMEIAP